MVHRTRGKDKCLRFGELLGEIIMGYQVIFLGKFNFSFSGEREIFMRLLRDLGDIRGEVNCWCGGNFWRGGRGIRICARYTEIFVRKFDGDKE